MTREVRIVFGAGRLRQYAARYWRGQCGVWGRTLDMILAPAELAFRCTIGLRALAFERRLLSVGRAAVPVISVGNLTLGGTGKTPVTRWIAGELERRGRVPAILHGGYGLDEPALHRHWQPGLPVIIDRDRLEGAQTAVATGAEVVVLDDGFQHRRLTRDVDIVLISAEQWTRKPRLLPRGPWREPLCALRRASIAVVTRKVTSRDFALCVASQIQEIAPAIPVAQIFLAPRRWAWWGGEPCDPPGGPVVAVLSIAEPESFLAQAAAAGANVESALLFPDHHTYTNRDVEQIARVAGANPIITTAKDAVKFEALGCGFAMQVLEQDVVVEAGGAKLQSLLDRVCE